MAHAREWPDLSRTAAAIAAYDASDEYPLQGGPLAVAVGEAFALDTADRNDAETARGVRAGAWLRQLVRRWEQVR